MELVFKQANPALVNTLHAVPNKNSRRYKKLWIESYGESAYTWRLSRYVKSYEGQMMFSYYPMYERLGELQYTDVLSHLNNTEWFDFDYEPQNGDYLTIDYQYRIARNPGKYTTTGIPYFMAFTHKSGEWVYQRYYDEVLECITEGILIVG